METSGDSRWSGDVEHNTGGDWCAAEGPRVARPIAVTVDGHARIQFSVRAQIAIMDRGGREIRPLIHIHDALGSAKIEEIACSC